MSAIPIYHGQDFYVPYFEVKVEGRPLGQDVVRDILQVSYKDSLKEIDSFEVTINNWDAAARAFKYSDEDLFLPGKRLELWMGYYGRDRLRLMTKGEITSLRPTFQAGGQPTLAVTGLNLLHRLRTKQESRAYEDRTDSEVAQEIAGRLGVKLRTDPAAAAAEERHAYLVQDNQFDIIFLMRRARQLGYDLFVEEDPAGESTLYFGPTANVRQVTYRLTYGRSLTQFQPNLTTANQVGEVTVRGWDAVNKRKIEATARRGDLPNQGVGDRGGQAQIEKAFSQRREVVATHPIHSEREAEQLARGTLLRNAQDEVTGTGSVVGLPDLRAGRVAQLDGLGTRFSGRYFVTGTTHAAGDGGYTTQFECRREEL
jgi:uncharacterized protein